MHPFAQIREGAIFAGDFRVQRPLAEGGMGAVFLVEQISTGALRALKVMQPALLSALDPEVAARNRARFLDEARVGSRIDSEHVVAVLGAGIDEATGMPWLVMEFLKGQSLDDAITQRQRLSAEEVLGIFEGVGHALGEAHRVGVLHLDLKPENIFLASSRRHGEAAVAKVLDFGIAKLVHEHRRSATVTTTIGSPFWMAPEQAMRGSRVVPATDVWALGLIAYRALTGAHYWREGNVPSSELNVTAWLMEMMTGPLEAASTRAAERGLAQHLPAGFDQWFGRCVAREPAQRFTDASEAITGLRPVLGGAPTQAERLSAPAPSVPPTVLLGSIPTPPVARDFDAQAGARASRGRLRALTATTLVLSSLLVGGGLLSAWRWFRGTESNCADFALRWGEPVCVGELDSEARRGRGLSYRFEYRHGRVTRVSRRTSGGRLWDELTLPETAELRPDGVSQWIPVRDGDGDVLWLEGRDRNDRIARVWEYRRVSRTEWICAWRNRLGRLTNLGNGVVAARWRLDDAGVVSEVSWLNRRDRPARSSQGEWGVRFSRNEAGQALRSTYLDASGAPHARNGRETVRTLDRNARGDVVRETMLDAAGQPATGGTWFHRSETRRDSHGNPVEFSSFGVDGHLTLSVYGFARSALRYDARGNLVEWSAFGLDGAPTRNSEGRVRVVSRYDEVGDLIESAHFGLDGQPSSVTGPARFASRYEARGNEVERVNLNSDGRPTMAVGYAKFRQRYNARGDVEELSYFGPDDQPLNSTLEGYARATRRFDEHGNEVLREHFDASGQPANPRGEHTFSVRYDALGRPTEYSSLDSLGRPSRNVDSARLGIHYDEQDNAFEAVFLGTEGEQVLASSLCARIRRRFDESDREIEWSCLGLDDQLALSSNGNARRRYQLDEGGRHVVDLLYDAAGEPSQGVARITRRYNDRGELLEETYFGADEQLSSSGRGYARFTQRFDDRGHQVAKSYFGADGRPALVGNCAQETTLYSARGEWISSACLGADGELAVNSAGVARTVARLDDYGRIVERVQYGRDGRLAAGGEDCRRTVSRFDEHGWEIESDCLDDGDRLASGPQGYAQTRRRYDASGRAVEQSYFGVDGQPTAIAAGYQRVRWTYDEFGRQVSAAYASATGQPVNGRDGYARVAWRYDAFGQAVEWTYFGADGQPAMHREGFARVTGRYDARGNRTDWAYFGTDGTPICQPNGVAREMRRYDAQARVVEWAYFGTDERPMMNPATNCARSTVRYDNRGNRVDPTTYDAAGQRI